MIRVSYPPSCRMIRARFSSGWRHGGFQAPSRDRVEEWRHGPHRQRRVAVGKGLT